ncbi:MAG TPA: ABC transporter substrate-binding protein [Geobacteraceae bacterium]|nr:ABC transporter substrate-binding protein [Geobacteraceae bacterium]
MIRTEKSGHSRLQFIGMLLMLLFVATGAGAREVTDMFGRHFSLSDHPRKLYSASPPDTWLLYALDPTMLAGLNFPIREQDKRYLHPHVLRLPLVGGTFGEASTPNKEMLLRLNPELVVVSNDETTLSLKVNQGMKMLKRPVFEMTLARPSDYPEAFLRMGRILGREERAKKLSDYCRKTLAQSAAFSRSIPNDKRVSVYYAEGVDGLTTECDESRHNELIRLAGGVNVHRCKARDLFGMEKVTLEQVLIYNPDVILVMDKGFFRRVWSDSRWRRVPAVRNKRVYLIPDQPLNWFDRPPTFMRFIGLKWVMKCLYPKEYSVDIVREAREFYRLFLGVEVPDGEMRKIIGL